MRDLRAPLPLPDRLMTTWMGLVLVTFGNAMREPVTMTSPSALSASAAGGAVCECAVVWESRLFAKVQLLPTSVVLRRRLRPG